MTDIARRVSSNEGGSDDKSIRGGGVSGVHGGLWQQLADGTIRDDPGIHGRDVGRQFLGLQQLDGCGQHNVVRVFGAGHGHGARQWNDDDRQLQRLELVHRFVREGPHDDDAPLRGLEDGRARTEP